MFDSFGVGILYKPNTEHDTRTFENFIASIENHNIDVSVIRAGYYFVLDDVLFNVVALNYEGHGNINNYSLVIHAQHGETSFFFTGDAEYASERAILYYAHHIYADVLKVGHHGSRTSTSQAFLEAISPRYAVIQLGYGNQHGHPHNVVMDRLYDMGITVYRTDLNGVVTVMSNGVDIWVSSER